MSIFKNILIQAILVLITFVSSSSGLCAPDQKIVRVDEISLKKVLTDLGYGFFSMQGIPIRNADDFQAGLLGVPNSVEQFGRYEWPFTAFAASADLSMVAFGLNKIGFPKLTREQVSGKVAIVNLPDTKAQAPVLLQLYDLTSIDSSIYVSEVSFITNELLQISTVAPKNSASDQQHTRNYWFVSTTHKSILFNLIDELKDLDVINVRSFGESIYIVECREKKSPLSTYRILRFNPIHKEHEILLTVQDPKMGRRLFYDPVNEQGRDVWRLGDNHLLVHFSSYDENSGKYRSQVLEVKDSQASIFEIAEQSNNRLISGTNRFIRDYSEENVLQVQDGSGNTIRYPQLKGEDSWIFLEAFPGGFVGIEGNWDKYRHYLLDLAGNLRTILGPRLVKATYYDGGFLGASNLKLKSHGDLLLYRVIYDPKLLLDMEQRKMQKFSNRFSLSCSELF